MPQTVPPQRSSRRVMSQQQAQSQQQSSQSQQILPSVREEIRALNSSILVIAQKLKFIVRNEKILGRNLVVLSKKLNEVESKSGSEVNLDSAISSEQIKEIMSAIDENNRKISEVQAVLTELSENAVLMDKFQELKYVIDSINPLEFVTIKQLDSFVERKVLDMRQKKKI